MILVWGTYIKRRRLGWVADFCPICRKLRSHQILRIGEAGHLYYISLVQGTLVGHELICSVCHVTRDTDADLYESISSTPDADLAELENTTFPWWRETWKPRLKRARKLEAGQLTSGERQQLIQDVFLLLNDAMERQYQVRPFSPRGKKVATATLVYAFLLVIGTILFPGSMSDDDGTVAAIVFLPLVLGCIVTFGFMCSRHAFYRRHRLRPQVARALRPLQPSEEELEPALAKMRELDLRIGKKLKAQRILRWIDPRDDGLAE